MCKPEESQSSLASEDLILWNTYRIDLITAADRLTGDPEAAIIKTLLDPGPGPKAWENLYEAEQRLAAKRDDEAVGADWTRRIVEAERLGVTSAAALKARYDGCETPEGRKATYLTLLDDLHFRYAKRRLDRQTRKKAARWLNDVGLYLVSAGFLVTVCGWFATGSLSDFLAHSHLVYALWCGMLGAYFSHSISMRFSTTSLDYDLLIADYSRWSVIQRLIIGAIAAFIMYFLIAGRLLAGDLFPAIDYGAPLVTPAPQVPTLSIPAISFAKLLIWSIIAGFSEKLLPDQLSRLENSARDGGRNAQPPSR